IFTATVLLWPAAAPLSLRCKRPARAHTPPVHSGTPAVRPAVPDRWWLFYRSRPAPYRAVPWRCQDAPSGTRQPSSAPVPEFGRRFEPPVRRSASSPDRLLPVLSALSAPP